MDMQYLLTLQGMRDSLGEGVAKVVTTISDVVTSPVFYLIIAFVFWCVNKKKGLFYVFSLVWANFLNGMLKITFCVFRPWLLNTEIRPFDFSLTEATGYSFPSGHATAAAAIFGSIAWTERKRKWVFALCVFLCLLIGFTRNYLGVHTPQDVIVGIVSSILCVALFDRLLVWVDRKDGREFWMTGITLALLLAGLLYTELRVYPIELNGENVVDPISITNDVYSSIGMGIGLMLGWLIEKRWIRFEVEGTIARKALRFVIGAVGMVLVYFGLKKVFYAGLGDHWGRLVLYFLTVFYVLAIYPFFVKKAQDRLNKKASAAEAEA